MQNGRGVACLPSGKPMAPCRVRPHLSAWPVIRLLSTLALTRPYRRASALFGLPCITRSLLGVRRRAPTLHDASRANICIRGSSKVGEAPMQMCCRAGQSGGRMAAAGCTLSVQRGEGFPQTAHSPTDTHLCKTNRMHANGV